jgi:Transcription factor WhiB
VDDWRSFAACAAAVASGDADASWWFPTRHDAASPLNGGAYGKARRVCASCPVRVRCLEECMAVEADVRNSDLVGMFGGATPAA